MGKMRTIYKCLSIEVRIYSCEILIVWLAILHNYKQNDYDLLQTVKKTLGRMSVIDYSEIELGPTIGEGGLLKFSE